MSDREIFAEAHKENRIVLTTDLDFGEIAVNSRAAKISVIIFRQEDRTPTSINRYLEAVLNVAKEELKRGAIITVQEGRIRVRHLSRD